MPKQQQLCLCIPAEPITGFCYPFAQRLLEKLLELKKDGRLIERISGARVDEKTRADELAIMYASQLSVQIHGEAGLSELSRKGGMESFMTAATEFLDAFVNKEVVK